MIRRQYSSELEKWALEMFSSAAYLSVNKKLLQHYGPDIAVFLSNLIDKYKYFIDKELLQDGKWFFVIHERQIAQTGLTITKLRTCKTILKNDGVLETNLKGAPPKEWYRLHLDRLLREILLMINGKESLPLIVSDSYHSIKENKEEVIIPSKKPTIQERNKQYLPLAKYLANIILTKKNISFTTAQISSWANEIRQLSESNKIDIHRIKKALKWYKEQIGGEYIPVIESGYSFRVKFSKLENAMNRKTYKQNKFIIDDGIKYVMKADGEYYHCRTGKRYIP